MKVLVTGSTGLIGRALVPALTRAGHDVIRLVRRVPQAGEAAVRWDPARGEIDAPSLEGLDAVVHLAGEGIGDRRWTEAQKARIVDSRIDGTTLLATTLAALDEPPSVLVSGSAIGAYGDTGDTSVTEDAPRGTDFLADLVQKWEAAAAPAAEAGIRVAYPRTGIVLSADGGTLGAQLLPFKLGLGGRIGDGQQWFSWISITDEVAALQWMLDNDVHGPVNLTAPNPVTVNEFARSLGRALRRPALFRVPASILKVGLGEGAAALLDLQRVVPSRAIECGYEYRYPTVASALRDLV